MSDEFIFTVLHVLVVGAVRKEAVICPASQLFWTVSKYYTLLDRDFFIYLVYSSRYGMSYMLRCKVWDLCFGRVLLEFYVSMKLRTGSTFEHVLLMKLRE